MRIIAPRTLNCYAEKFAGTAGSLLSWHDLVSKNNYENHAALKQDFPSADYVGNNRYVFNIKGNDFRLIVAVSFQARLALVKWFGTHAEYDKIDAKEVNYDDPCH